MDLRSKRFTHSLLGRNNLDSKLDEKIESSKASIGVLVSLPWVFECHCFWHHLGELAPIFFGPLFTFFHFIKILGNDVQGCQGQRLHLARLGLQENIQCIFHSNLNFLLELNYSGNTVFLKVCRFSNSM